MGRYCVVTIATLVLAGCGDILVRPGPATLEEAMQRLDAGLPRILQLSDSDLLSDEGRPRYEVARRFIREKQCSTGTANPLLVTSLPVKLRLTGELEGEGTIKFSGLRTERVSGAVRTVSANGVEIPLRVSALAELPNEYLREMSALLEIKGLPDEAAQKLKREIPRDYEKLIARVGSLVETYDPRACWRFARGDRPTNIFIPPTY